MMMHLQCINSQTKFKPTMIKSSLEIILMHTYIQGVDAVAKQGD